MVALAAAGQTAVYPIDASQRGTEIINTFNSLSPTKNRGTLLPEIILQTNLPNSNLYTTYKYLRNGVIPYVQNITQTTYNTLLIVSYLVSATGTTQQYIVLPVEQITGMFYFANYAYASTTPFVSTPPSGSLPYFSIDSRQRGVDIVSAVNQLLSSPFKTSGATQVWIQTTLSGPFNYPLTGGLIQNVTSISVNSSLIQIVFSPPGYAQNQVIVVAPEQVQQIIYLSNFVYP